MQKRQMTNVMMAMKATPPTTPPAMAPTLVLLLDEDEFVWGMPACELGTHIASVHVVHPSPGFWIQVWSLGQEGHVGCSSGHATHRLKMFLSAYSASATRQSVIERETMWRQHHIR